MLFLQNFKDDFAKLKFFIDKKCTHFYILLGAKVFGMNGNKVRYGSIALVIVFAVCVYFAIPPRVAYGSNGIVGEMQNFNVGQKEVILKASDGEHGDDAIHVKEGDDSIRTAVRIAFPDGYTDSQKKASLFTMDFQCDPSESVADDGSVDVSAHILAKMLYKREGPLTEWTNNAMAVGIDLEKGINLKIVSTTNPQKIPIIYATAKAENENPAGAIGIQTAGGTVDARSNLTFDVATTISVSGATSDLTNGFCDSAAVVIGSGSPYYSETGAIFSLSHCDIVFNEDVNSLFSSSNNYDHSSSAVIGNAIGSGVGAVTAGFIDNTVTFGNKNFLISDSRGEYSSAVVIGNTISSDAYHGTMENSSVTFGAENVLISTSYGSNENGMVSAAVVIGSVVADNGQYSGGAIVKDIIVTLGDKNALSAFAVVTGQETIGIGVPSVATVIGSGACHDDMGGGPSSTARGVVVNANGEQLFAALALSKCLDDNDILNPSEISAVVNVFGAKDTDKSDEDGSAGWRMGIYSDRNMIGDSTVNIIGAKLASAAVTEQEQGNVFELRFSEKQGDINLSDYARAFALGSDFQIYIGGKVNGDRSFSPVFANWGTNTVNVVGAIAKAGESKNTDGSSMTIDNLWNVNTFGPVRDLGTLTINNGARLAIYEQMYNIKNIIVGRDGTLEIGDRQGGANKFATILDDAASKLILYDKDRNQYDGKEGSVRLVGDDYPWKGPGLLRIGNGSTLTLNPGSNLLIHVDSSDLNGKIAAPKSFIFLEGGSGKIQFNGGKIYIDNNGRPLPADTYYWLIASGAFGDDGLDRDAFASQLTVNGKEISYNPDNHDEAALGGTEVSNKEIVALDPNAFDLYAADVTVDSSGHLATAIDDLSHGIVSPSGGLIMHVKREIMPNQVPVFKISADVWRWKLQTSSMFANDLITGALEGRLSRVKGSLNDPFIYAIGGHSNHREVGNLGHKDTSYGVVIGADYLSTMDDERYLRVGAILAYVRGKTTFSGDVAATDQSANHDHYTAALYGAYESFSEENLKTDISAVGGFSYSKNKLHWTSADTGRSASVDAVDIFAKINFIKNVFSFSGCQCGPWLSAKYHHIRQEAYEERDILINPIRTDATNYDFIDTVVGLNLEVESGGDTSIDNTTKFTIRAGWNCQPLRKNSDYNVYIDGLQANGNYHNEEYGVKNSAIFLANVARKLNSNWTLTGTWVGRFSKDVSNNNFSIGAEYTF
ncbi:MAG: autotransporter outer membrane beta-barrel domain-containing protein [Puniceicoccales bacterium]|jgi:hypothetical protein|nr:autotransporter outer membrane beta-barrel domain-containing protein [Puniceicoccales bacterium]